MSDKMKRKRIKVEYNPFEAAKWSKKANPTNDSLKKSFPIIPSFNVATDVVESLPTLPSTFKINTEKPSYSQYLFCK
ncbi:hypothetical protein PGB90_003947 [Kerria lacca]